MLRIIINGYLITLGSGIFIILLISFILTITSPSTKLGSYLFKDYYYYLFNEL